ncbi:DUF481 domain-containing protein [Thiomicrorhabdus aquaedulcis]|uniref:DUF481 domain-containing protein n=1 Tax=Thiomicrorhabdus aquaedulcis TaxID=2211106 RepID=UPI000FDCC549|nr:DUF481 domain-containing protein [Thiomicrorhabdus aquaedulcis]
MLIKHRVLCAFSSIALLTGSASVMASTTQTGFNGSGEFGLTDSTGNTTSTAIYGALKLNYVQKVYEIKSLFEGAYKSENSLQTQERYIADAQYNHFYNEARSYYSFAQSRLEQDRFEEIDLNALVTFGLGRLFINTPTTQLSAEAGLGQQTTDYSQRSGEKDLTQTIGRLKIDFNHQINQQISFAQDALYFAGQEQNKLETNTGFKVKLADHLKLKLAYKYRHNDQPAEGNKKTDGQTIMTVLYDF